MGLRFYETMRGMVELGGQQRAFEFSVQVNSRSWFLPWNLCELEGTVSLEGFCQQAPLLRGTLDMGLPLRRALRYDLSFRDVNDKLLRFVGQKLFKVTRPTHSMTNLSGHLYERGMVLGRARLAFDLWELPSFLASFGFVNREPQGSRVEQ